MNITVKIVSAYGIERIYPVCEKAFLFTRIAKTSTLSSEQITHIKTLGYTVKVHQGAKTL